MTNYTQDEKGLIFLSSFEFMSCKKITDVLYVIGTPKEIFNLEEGKKEALKGVLKNNYQTLINGLNKYDEDSFFEELERKNIRVITIYSKEYPQKLRKLEQYPYVLFYVGDLKLFNYKAIAIVGSRNPTPYGKLITGKYAKELADAGLVVISGLATGVDKHAHEGALEVKGKTIAVLGNGFDHMFPAMNVNLARSIAKSGLVITEYYPSIKATKYSFPQRNRIIAALSDAILITEARPGSGSLYTKDYGDEIGLSTYCVPGNITSELSYSTNELIKRGCAICTTEPEDILMDFGINKEKETKTVQSQINLTIEENAICELLANGEKDFVFLQERTGFSTQSLNISLTSLEIRGIIKKLAGNEFMLCK